MNDHYLEVLQHYEGEVPEVYRGRGAWICEYGDRVRLLKEYRGTTKRLEFEEAVLDALKEYGILDVDQYVRNAEGELLTAAEDGTKYILKDWFSDRECNLKERREILTAVSWIARLHLAFRQITWNEEWNLGSILPPALSDEMQRHNREMKRVRQFITKKRKKNEFELCVMGNFSDFYAQALEAQNGLELLGKNTEQIQPFLCHGDLNQHHVLMHGNGAAFIEFSQMHLGEQMADLYHFMRKVMEKHGWNEHLGLTMLDTYDAVLPISARDRRCLYYLFLYPEKYWKQLNYYNSSNKVWIPEKNVEKIKNLEAQQELKMKFLTKID